MTDTTLERPTAGTDLGRTLPGRLLRHAEAAPRRVALRKKDLGRWKEYTWLDYATRAANVGLGLAALGVGPGDKVAIHSENRPAWLLADLGAQGIGAVAVGVYPTSPEAEVAYLLEHSEARVLIAEDEEQLDKALAVTADLPQLRKIIVIDPRGLTNLDDELVMTFADLEALGAAQADDVIDAFHRHVAEIDPSAPALIVYTSGTTGPPKGAMLSHDNLQAAASTADEVFGVGPGDEVLSYLPLCHIAERLISVINAVTWGYTTNFGAGGESFSADLRDVQPTFFLGVPRVWEKMLAAVQIRMADASWLKRVLYRFWTARGARIARKRMAGTAGPLDHVGYFLGWLFVFRALRDRLGMSRVRGALSGAAPVAPQVLEFFWSIGIPVREGYGQTENTAQATITPPDDVRIGAVGRVVPGTDLRIADDGEILTRGPGTFVGYFKNEAATAETIDSDGWLHTGDVGELDADGFLTITDRKKDIIITAGGKNISPSEIENRLKVSPFVREAVVIGDRRKYLTALIGIEADTVGSWATRRNVAYTTYEDLSAKPEVRELIGEWVSKVNTELAQVESIKEFTLLRKELDQEDGELTATQKVKRRAIEGAFASDIEAMYGGTAR